jgi:anti-anti-sigma regulatory factor
MYLVEIDHERNRIHITLSERFDEGEAKALLAELRSRFEELEKDFHVLCDLTTLEHFDRAARRQFKRVMDLCNEGGVRKIIRIIPDPLDNFGLTVMSHFHYDNGVQIINCRNIKEALKHLTS